MKRFGYIIAMAIAMHTASAFAAEQKIGVIDMQKVMESSLAYKDISTQVEKKAETYKASAAKMQEKLQKQYQELEAQKSVLAADAYTKKSKELEREAESSQESAYMERVSLDRAYSGVMKSLEEKLLEIVKRKAETSNLSVVVASAAVLYSKTDMDVTNGVIEELNIALPSMKVDFDAQKETKIVAKDAVAQDTKASK
jgi:outer membrane protein